MSDAAERAEAATKRRADRAAKSDAARAEQYATDLEAIEKLEAEHGYTLNVEHQVTNYVPGAPVVVGIRVPSELEYKRFFQRVTRAEKSAEAKIAALVELAKCCWAYPADEEQRALMLEANGALFATVGAVANSMAELKKEEAGKG